MPKICKKLDDILYEHKVKILIGFITIILIIGIIVLLFYCLNLYEKETVDFCEECGGKMIYTDKVEHISLMPMNVGGKITLLPFVDVDYVYTCESCGKTTTTDIKPE